MEFVTKSYAIRRVHLEDLWGVVPGILREADGCPAFQTLPEENPFRRRDGDWGRGIKVVGKRDRLLTLQAFLRSSLFEVPRLGRDSPQDGEALYLGALALWWDLSAPGSWKRLALLVRYWLEACSYNQVTMALREGELLLEPCEVGSVL